MRITQTRQVRVTDPKLEALPLCFELSDSDLFFVSDFEIRVSDFCETLGHDFAEHRDADARLAFEVGLDTELAIELAQLRGLAFEGEFVQGRGSGGQLALQAV